MSTERVRERSYPWVIGAIAVVLCWLFAPQPIYVKAVDKLVQPVINVSALLFGFMLTVAGLLNSLDRKAIADLRESGLFPVLLGYIKAAMGIWITVAVIGMVAVLIDPAVVVWRQPLLRSVAALWAGGVVTGLVASQRVAHIMFLILASGRRSITPVRDDRVEAVGR